MEYRSSISQEQIDQLELAHFKGEIVLIDKLDESYFQSIEEIKYNKVLGFDTETKPSFVAGEKRNGVALLQLSTSNKAYLFRLNHIALPKELSAILSNKRILKVGAAVHDDIKGLQRYNKFTPNGFIDLQNFVDKYGIAEKSVRKMAAIILGVKISKSQQLSNWEGPSLTEAQLQYASIDAWACLEMYKRIKD